MSVLIQSYRKIYNHIHKKSGELLLQDAASRNDDVHMTTMPNGIRLASQSSRGGQFEFAINLKVGSWDDPAGKEGMAHFVEHLLSTPKMQQEFSNRGGELNLYIVDNKTRISGRVNSSKSSIDFSLHAIKHILSATASEGDVGRERVRIHNEINMENDSPIARVLKASGNLYMPYGHMYGRLGTEASIGSITVSDLNEFKKLWYNGQNITIGFTGPFSNKHLHKGAARMLSDISSEGAQSTAAPRYHPKDIHLKGGVYSQLYYQIVFSLPPAQSYREECVFGAVGGLLRDRLSSALQFEHGYAYTATAMTYSEMNSFAHALTVGSILPEHGSRVVPIVADAIGRLCTDEGRQEIERFLQNNYTNQIPSLRMKYKMSAEQMIDSISESDSLNLAYDQYRNKMSLSVKDIQDCLIRMVAKPPSIITAGNAEKIHSGQELAVMIKERRTLGGNSPCSRMVEQGFYL